MASRFLTILGLAALLAGAANFAVAQDASSSAESTVPDQLQGMVGDWVLEQEDPEQPKCPLTLTDTEAKGGWAVVRPEDCPAPYPAAATMAAWNVDDNDGSVILLDAAGNETMRLFEDEDGLFDTDPNTEPRFYLLPPYDEDDTGGEADSD